PRCARVVSRATDRAACAALRSGLSAIACAINASSGLEWNSVHQSAEMSAPFRKRCVSPPATPGVDTVAVCGWAEYASTAGASGFLKSGPTAQPERNRTAAGNARHDGRTRDSPRLACSMSLIVCLHGNCEAGMPLQRTHSRILGGCARSDLEFRPTEARGFASPV